MRRNRSELLRFRAVERIGKKLVIFGAQYAEWLNAQSGRVEGYDCPANREVAATTEIAA